MPYVFLFMAVASLGMLGVMHKLADYRRCQPDAINFFLFFGATILMFGVSIWRMGPAKAFDVPRIAWVMAVGCGLLASLATLNFQHGIRFGKISTSWLIINLSTALPTLLSIALYHETVSKRRLLGLLLAVIALIILWLERTREERLERAAATVLHIPGGN